MEIFATVSVAEIAATIIYSLVGVLMLGVCWWVIRAASPFPIIKEIEQDQNVALAILIASVFLSLSIIIAAVILS